MNTSSSNARRAPIAERRRRAMSASVESIQIYHDDPLQLVRGQGAHVFDDSGRRYLDASSQSLCISIGFAHPLTVRLVGEQVARLPHCTTLFMNEASVAYAEALLALMPPHPSGDDWVLHLVNSGSEAIDLAYQMARSATGHFELLYLRNAYHGLHFGAAATTAFSVARPPVAAPGFVQVIHPCQYHGVFGTGVAPYVQELQRTIDSATCGRVAGIVLEPIQGFGGVVPLPAGYMAQAARIVRDAGGLLIVDEVQTGFGRMGSHLWGFEAHGVTPDLVVIGKGMGNGLPISGVIARRSIGEAFAKIGFYNTFGGNPVACAAAHSVLLALDQESLQANAQQRGEQLGAGLLRLQQRHALIGDVRGTGLITGIELVRDRRSRTPATDETARVHRGLREHGVLCVRGTPGRNVLRFNPPLCASADDIDALLGALDNALAAA